MPISVSPRRACRATIISGFQTAKRPSDSYALFISLTSPPPPPDACGIKTKSKAAIRGVGEHFADRFDDPANAPIRDPQRYTEEMNLPVLHLMVDGDLDGEEHVPARVFYRGRSLLAGAKHRGRSSRAYPQKSFTLKFPAATPFDEPDAGGGFRDKRKIVRGLSDEQVEHMEREATNIDREFRMIEQSYGTDHLDLVLATGYLARLAENVRIVHHLARHHPELLAEFQRLVQLRDAA